MFGYNRKKRPVDLGPYPLEKHKRDRSIIEIEVASGAIEPCLLYTSPSPRDATLSRMPSSA